MKKIKNNGACVLDMVLGFLGSSDTQTPYSFSFLFSSFFFFFFPRSFSASILSFSSFFLLLFLLSPSIFVLSLLELSLSLDFAQTQTQTHMPQAPLSNQWVSLFSIFFFFWWVSLHMVLPTCLGEVEGMGLWGSAWWRVWVCSDWHLWWSFGDGTDQSLGQSVMGCMIVRWLDQ